VATGKKSKEAPIWQWGRKAKAMLYVRLHPLWWISYYERASAWLQAKKRKIWTEIYWI